MTGKPESPDFFEKRTAELNTEWLQMVSALHPQRKWELTVKAGQALLEDVAKDGRVATTYYRLSNNRLVNKEEQATFARTLAPLIYVRTWKPAAPISTKGDEPWLAELSESKVVILHRQSVWQKLHPVEPDFSVHPSDPRISPYRMWHDKLRILRTPVNATRTNRELNRLYPLLTMYEDETRINHSELNGFSAILPIVATAARYRLYGTPPYDLEFPNLPEAG